MAEEYNIQAIMDDLKEKKRWIRICMMVAMN